MKGKRGTSMMGDSDTGRHAEVAPFEPEVSPLPRWQDCRNRPRPTLHEPRVNNAVDGQHHQTAMAYICLSVPETSDQYIPESRIRDGRPCEKTKSIEKQQTAWIQGRRKNTGRKRHEGLGTGKRKAADTIKINANPSGEPSRNP